MKLSVKTLRDIDPWLIARRLGIGYTGDTNTIPHGGTYYNTHNWESLGYADCVNFCSDDRHTWVEIGTINKHGTIAEMVSHNGWKIENGIVYCKHSGDEIGELSPEMEIELSLSYWGLDVDQSQYFGDNAEDNPPEGKIFGFAKSHIKGLAKS